MNNMKKRGISPIIATILLVVIVMVLALIIFLWARGFVKESVRKQGASAQQKCGEISLSVAYVNDVLEISNNGDVPIYRLEIEKKNEGNIELQREVVKLKSGDSTTISVGSEYEEIKVIPAILGEAKTSKKIYTCKNNFFIAEI